MTQIKEYLIPSQELTLRAFQKFCEHWGMHKEAEWTSDQTGKTTEECWVTEDRIFSLNFVEDDISGFAYVIPNGSDDDGIVGNFISTFPIVTRTKMLELADQAAPHDEHINNIFRMSIAFEEFDETALGAFVNYAKQGPTPQMRKAAMEGMARRVWPQSLEVIDWISINDSDEDVKAHARDVIMRWPNDPV